MDGFKNNDGIKHSGDEKMIETWSKSLHEIKVYDNLTHLEHIQYLRHRFVIGASSWLAGENGSSDNDKDVLGYSNSQWEFIWSTMAEDGAWAVPNICDDAGNILMRNWAPELMIKYIAHDLKCHIIVFDLQLGIVQFCSGNRLKEDNVVYESPLLLYSTGSHFQSVVPLDHDYFIGYAKKEEYARLPKKCTEPRQAPFPRDLRSGSLTRNIPSVPDNSSGQERELTPEIVNPTIEKKRVCDISGQGGILNSKNKKIRAFAKEAKILSGILQSTSEKRKIQKLPQTVHRVAKTSQEKKNDSEHRDEQTEIQ